AYRYSPFLLKTDFTLKSPPGVNRKRDPNWVLDVNGVFPNRLIDLADTGYFSYGLWPMAVDRTRWEVQYYFPRPTTAAQRFSQEHNRVTFRDILMEDAGTLERIQSVIGSGAKTHFVFQDEEILLRHDNKILNEYMGLSKPAAKKRKGSIDARPAAVA
ncbi:MAG: RHO alpha subunit C-terminal catalytic domain-containing protein, partial [Blastocatellia bacterium]